MQQFLPTYRRPDGPRYWKDPDRLSRDVAAVGRGGVVWVNTLRGWLGDVGPLDRRGVLAWDPASDPGRIDYALDWACDVLGLRACNGWRPGPPTWLREFLGGFYDCDRYVAFVIVESCRDAILTRFAAAPLLETADVGRRPRFDHPLGRLPKRMKLAPGLLLPTTGLRLALPGDRPRRGMRLADLGMQRTLRVPGGGMPLNAAWRVLCAADPVDDGPTVAAGRAPAGNNTRRSGGVNTGRLMSWVKVLPPAAGPAADGAESCAFDVDPATGKIMSVRWTPAPLQMLCEMDPRLDGWLAGVRGGTDA